MKKVLYCQSVHPFKIRIYEERGVWYLDTSKVWKSDLETRPTDELQEELVLRRKV